ncbi:hypothetical protein Ancab_011049 [Ancistrocladus abbreviatus]
MASICAERNHHHNHHKFQQFLSAVAAAKKTSHLQDLNIPPRKLLSRRTAVSPISPDASAAVDFFNDSSPSKQEEALMQKFLPCNSDVDDGFDPDADPYSSDQFRMFEFKVRRCTRSRSHDWTDCPFAHPGEKARRRDPRRYHYTGTVCPDYRRGGCSKGDECEFAHGVFECWLHPGRYRTEACKDGKNCKRKVCFFAHSARELRILPSSQEESGTIDSKYLNLVNMGADLKNNTNNNIHICKHCCSPTSTPLGMSNFSPPLSPSLSPPVSPLKEVAAVLGLSGFSSISRMGISNLGADSAMGLSYKDVLNELMNSLERVNLGQDQGNNGIGSWIDGFNYHEGDDQQQRQFVLSPTPNPSKDFFSSSNSFDSSSATCLSSNALNVDDAKCSDGGLSGPDLGWVNDLLM